MGDILQTPQFQMRRLKKQLADERNNRDELELELSESLKLLTEKGRYLTECVGTGDGEHLGFTFREALVTILLAMVSLLLTVEFQAHHWHKCQCDLLDTGFSSCVKSLFCGTDNVPPLLSCVPWIFADSVSFLSWADAQIAMMQQRIDHLALLNEKQAASSQEPSELEELRSKNERYDSPTILPASSLCWHSRDHTILTVPLLAASLCDCMRL